MPSLDHEASKQFWQEYMGGSIYPLISFIEETDKLMVNEGGCTLLTYDIEGCFPNMPKGAIREMA